MNEELTKLIEQASQGDAKAFEALLKQKAQHMYYIALKLMKNNHDAEDAVQEAMLRMHAHIGELKQPEAFHSWMYQIVSRTCFNLKKKLARDDHEELAAEDGLNEMRREFLPQEYIEDKDKRDFLLEVIDGLQERYKITLLLFYYEELSYQEIAQVMGTTVVNVDNVLRRARKKIRKQLDEKYAGQITYVSFQGVVALPVLSQVFQLDSAAVATPEILARILASVSGILGTGAAVGGTAGAVAGGANSTVQVANAAGATGAEAAIGASATKSVGGLSLTAKVAIGVMAAATATGGAMAFLGNEAGAGFATSPPGQEEQAILTLEDMIGEEAATHLRKVVAQEEPETVADWTEYLESIAAQAVYSADDGEAYYTLFQLEKQDKQLLILQKQPTEIGGVSANHGLEVVFRFTDKAEVIPVRGELIASWERWRP